MDTLQLHRTSRGLRCLAKRHFDSSWVRAEPRHLQADFYRAVSIWIFKSQPLTCWRIISSPWCLPFAALPWTPFRSSASGWLAAGIRTLHSGIWQCWQQEQPEASCPSGQVWSSVELLLVRHRNVGQSKTKACGLLGYNIKYVCSTGRSDMCSVHTVWVNPVLRAWKHAELAVSPFKSFKTIIKSKPLFVNTSLQKCFRLERFLLMCVFLIQTNMSLSFPCSSTHLDHRHQKNPLGIHIYMLS